MEIVGVGTEIVECLRVGRMIEQHGELFLNRIYTEREIRFCQSRRRATEHFAARWAAKEAVFRALGRPWRKGMLWTDLEISPELNNFIQVRLSGVTKELAQKLRLSNLLVSMGYCRAYATAHAIAVRG